ncbi:MAG: hypothetical protein IKG25_03110 [Mogibacterium sp.]|nr:hypothetical protein [Mogibacterium sp.]
MKYFAASMVIAAAAAVYGLFSHGVYSYYMTYAFMIPLLAGALPHMLMALREAKQLERNGWYETGLPSDGVDTPDGDAKGKEAGTRTEIMSFNEAQLAFVTTLTAGSLLKGALDIYGTTNRLLAVYPIIALLILLIFAVQSAQRLKSQRRCDADQYAGSDAAE